MRAANGCVVLPVIARVEMTASSAAGLPADLDSGEPVRLSFNRVIVERRVTSREVLTGVVTQVLAQIRCDCPGLSFTATGKPSTWQVWGEVELHINPRVFSSGPEFVGGRPEAADGHPKYDARRLSDLLFEGGEVPSDWIDHVVLPVQDGIPKLAQKIREHLGLPPAAKVVDDDGSVLKLWTQGCVNL